MLKIRPAKHGDAKALTQLMHQSSAYEGNYASILDGYAITPSQLDAEVFYVAVLQDAIAGFYSLTLTDEPHICCRSRSRSGNRCEAISTHGG